MLGVGNKLAKQMLLLTGAFIVGLLIVLLLVPLLGPGWHLLHGDSISYGGWSIPVPRGFSVKRAPGGPVMWKFALGVPFFDAPYGHISLYGLGKPARQPFEYDRDYSRFEKGVTQQAVESGYRFESKRTTSVGKNSGYCFEFTRPLDLKHPISGRSLLRCAVEGSSVVLFFEGDPRYIPDVLATFQRMSPESQTPNP